MAKLGLNAKLYWRSAGSYESPTWTENTLISDLSQSAAWGEAEANARESRIEQAVKAMLGLEWTGKLKKKPLDATYEAFMNAFLSDEVLDLLILDGDKDVEGNRGWRIDAQIFDASEDQSMTNALYEDIRIKPIIITHAALAVKVAAGPLLTYSTPGVNGGTFA